MKKLWAIIKREYLINVRRPSFIASTLGLPLIILVSFVISGTLATNEANRPVDELATVGYVDRSPEQVLSADIIPDEMQGRMTRYDSDEAARAALESETIGVYFEVTENYMNDGRINVYSLQPVPEALQDRIVSMITANLVANVDTSIPFERFDDPVDELTVRALDSGRTVSGDGVIFLFMLPIMVGLFLVLTSITSSSFMMYSVVEEKTNRIIEVLVTSVKPMELLAGKVIGLGFVGLTQVAILLTMAFIGLGIARQYEFLAGLAIPTDLLIVAILYFMLSYLMMSALQAGLGVLVGSEQEGSQLTGLLILPYFIPLFAIIVFFENPNGPVAVVMSMLPFTGPLSMLFRMGVTAVPAWQIILSLVVTAASAIFFIWASARVFRWAMLLYGKKFEPMNLIRSIFRGKSGAIATTAPKTQENV